MSLMSKLDWKTIDRPIIALSPMADMTDSAFCRVVKSMASPIVFREMVSSEAVVRGNDKTMGMTEIHPEERPIVQQLFGADPDTMAKAAAIIEKEHHPEGFDINMGCPVYKITSNFNGAALMKEKELAREMVQKVKAAISVPLSVKIRLGWDDPNECLEFVKLLEEAGADLITIHGRTKAQGYSGVSDWEMIAKCKELVDIPVLANGDIHTAPLVFDALDTTKCDGVLIARGALGNPWIFKQVEEMIEANKKDFKDLPRYEQEQIGKQSRIQDKEIDIPLSERIRVIKMHLDYHLDQYGEKGIRTFRKHLTWYLKGVHGAKEYRAKMVRVDSKKEFLDLLHEMENALIG